MSNKTKNMRKLLQDIMSKKPEKLQGIDIEKEYALILEKRSSLSAQMRQLVLLWHAYKKKRREHV